MSNPVYRRDPTRSWRMWNIFEIYLGDTGITTPHLYVPNVNDLVFDHRNNTVYKVIAVDTVTAIPTLEAISLSVPEETITDPDDLMFGLRSYEPHGVNRIFIDNMTEPFTLSVDSRYRVYGSEGTKVKLFLGSDTSDTGTVVSHTLNSNGVIVSELVDLEPIYGSNNTIKRPQRFHTTRSLEDGERVTMVVYNAAGRVCGEHPFIVRNANMISGPTATDVYIEDIDLIGDLISDTDPLLIENPLHVPFTTTTLLCRVHYSNGMHTDHSIDGNKVKLHGVQNFNTGILGPTCNVVLSYYPTSTEPAINLQGVIRPSISKTYKLGNVGVLGDYAVKLYVIPIWDGSKYNLRVRLTDIRQSADIDVTSFVTIKKVDDTPFKGNDFGRQQHIKLTLNLDQSNPGLYPGQIHVQQLKITVNPPGTQATDDWVIDYGGDGFTYFGAGHYCQAEVGETHRFRVDINQSNILDWFSYLYWAVDPAFDNSITDRAPTPTHVRLEHGNSDGGRVIGTYPVESWDGEFSLGRDRDWEQGYPMVMVWVQQLNGQEHVLAVSPLSIKYVYNPDGDNP